MCFFCVAWTLERNAGYLLINLYSNKKLNAQEPAEMKPRTGEEDCLLVVSGIPKRSCGLRAERRKRAAKRLNDQNRLQSQYQRC